MQLLKSNSHGNGLEVYKGESDHYKIAHSLEGNAAIEREKQGYDWIGQEVEYGTYDYRFIKVPTFSGKTFPLYNKITGNEMYIKQLIKYYQIEWSKRKYAVHGDLALCNVIYGDEIHIVDWEHFHYAKPEYWGFDIVNMLFILLQYEYRWLDLGFNWAAFVKPNTADFIMDCVLSLGNKRFLNLPFTNCAWYINKYMNKNKFILGKQKQTILESLDALAV